MGNDFSFSKKWIKYSLIALSLLVIIGFLSSFFVKKIALEKITNIPGISCANLSFNLFTACIDLEQLTIERPIKKEESEVLGLVSNKAHIHGLSYWQYLKNDKVYIDEVIFEDLEVVISPNQKNNGIQRDSNAQKNTPKVILIDRFLINQGKLAVENKQFEQLQLDTFSTNIEHLQFNLEKDSQQVVWNKLEFSGNHFLLNQSEIDNKLLVKNFELSKNNQLLINQLEWKPKYAKTKYLDHHKYRKAHLDLAIPTLSIQAFPVADLIFKQAFKARSITIEDSAFKIYSDKNKKACPDCLKKYPYESLIDAKMLIDVDSILVKNGKIVFEELGEGKQKAGKLDWTKVYASVYNLTNNADKVKTHLNTLIDIQAVFVEDGNVDLHFEWPNFNKNADYRFYGAIDKVKLKEINSFLVFSKRFRIRQGEVSRFAFNGRGNLTDASGAMELRYKNLEIAFLNEDRSPRKFLSKVVNKIVGNKNNPNKKEKLRKGKMFFERNQHISFISNWWKTMQTGIKSVMLPNIFLPDELEHETK